MMTTRGNGTDPRSLPIAVTGATGFLGSHIVDVLLAAGRTVRVAVRPTSDRRWLAGKDLDVHVVDLTDPAETRDFLTGTGGLIHCAGVVSALSEKTYHLGNVVTTETLLEAARDAWTDAASNNVPAFVLVSSLAAHGPAGLDAPARESDPCRPITAYGRSKLAAERLLFAANPPFRTVALRPPALYGPRDTGFLPLLKAARFGLTARFGRRMQGLSLVDGRDVARAAVTLLTCEGARGVYFVDDGHCGYRWSELAEALSVAVGRRVHSLTIPLGLLHLAARLIGEKRAARLPVLKRDRLRDVDCDGWVCDGSRLVAETDFRPQYDAATGLRSALDFARREGWL